MKKFCILSIAIMAVAIINACNSDEQETSNLIPEEFQGDNYYSNVSAEYEVKTTIPVAMTEEEYADETVRNDIVAQRITVFGFYLTIYLYNKNESNANNDYAGFDAMARNLSRDDISITGDATNGYFITFTMDIAGPTNLLTTIPRAAGTENSSTFMFDLQMPKGLNPDNIQLSELSNFDPATYTGELETARCEIKGLPAVGNAYPHFEDFIADGVYDITIFVGYDYTDGREIFMNSKALFNRLVALGFTLPPGVQKYEDLTYQSGPLTGALYYNRYTASSRLFNINVRFFNYYMFTNDMQRLHDTALQEMIKRDVFFYIGHAKPYHTLYLDPNHQADITHQDIINAPFTDKQQLFIFDGCRTYSQYADMIYLNSVKDEDNLDVITSVNAASTDAAMPLNILNNIIKFNSQGYFIPVDYYTLIENVNKENGSITEMTFYGVIGIDGNPQLHPYADITKIGTQCNGESDPICGNFEGNLCGTYPDGISRCVVRTLSKTGCPSGTRFFIDRNVPMYGAGFCGQ